MDLCTMLKSVKLPLRKAGSNNLWLNVFSESQYLILINGDMQLQLLHSYIQYEDLMLPLHALRTPLFSIIDVDLVMYGYSHSNDFSKHKIKVRYLKFLYYMHSRRHCDSQAWSIYNASLWSIWFFWYHFHK